MFQVFSQQTQRADASIFPNQQMHVQILFKFVNSRATRNKSKWKRVVQTETINKHQSAHENGPINSFWLTRSTNYRLETNHTGYEDKSVGPQYYLIDLFD